MAGFADVRIGCLGWVVVGEAWTMQVEVCLVMGVHISQVSKTNIHT